MLTRVSVVVSPTNESEILKEPVAKKRKETSGTTVGKDNFLLLGAKRAKALRSARTAARVGCKHAASTFNDAKGINTRLSNTGSGIPLSDVVRLKYVKGFTQAVSMPCRLEDIL
jgi:chromosome transmission fidelity protein 18